MCVWITWNVTVMVPFAGAKQVWLFRGQRVWRRDPSLQAGRGSKNLFSCLTTSQPDNNVDTKIITINYTRCPSVRAGTVALRTASAATTATPTARVEPQMLKPSQTLKHLRHILCWRLRPGLHLLNFHQHPPLPLETQIELHPYLVSIYWTSKLA